LYNSKDSWTIPLNFKETLDSHQLFGDYLVDFRYFLINVHGYSEDELIELSNLVSVVFMLDRVEELEDILECFHKSIAVIKKLSLEEFQLLKSWSQFILARNLPQEGKEEITRILDESSPEEVDKMISNVEKVIKKSVEDAEKQGMEKGMEKGIKKRNMEIAKRMLAQGIDINTIASCTDLSKEEIEKLK